MLAPELKDPDQGVTSILEQLSRYLKLGLYVFLLKCDDMLGVFARATLEGSDMPPEAPLVRLVRDL